MKSLVLLLLAVVVAVTGSPAISGRTPQKDGWDDDDSMILENSTPKETEATTPSLEESTSLPLSAFLTLLPFPQEDEGVDKNETKYSEFTTEASVDSNEVEQTTSNEEESTSSTEEPDAVAIVELRKEPLTLEIIPLFKQKGGKMGLSPQHDSSGEMSTTESSEDDGETTPQDDGGDLTPTPLSYMVPPRQEEESFWKKYPLRNAKGENGVEDEEQDRMTTIATDLDPQMILTTIPPQQEEDEESFTTPTWEKELAEKLKKYLDKLANEIEITTTEQTTDATTTFQPQQEADNFDFNIFTTIATEAPTTTEGPLLGEDDVKMDSQEMPPPPPPKPRIPETPILEPESYQVPVPEMDQAIIPNSEASSQSEEEVITPPQTPPRTFMVPPAPPMPEADSEELVQAPRRKLYIEPEVGPSPYFPYGKRYSANLRDVDYFYRPSPSRQSPQSSFYYNPNQYQPRQPQFSSTRVTGGGYNSPSNPFGGYSYSNANRNPYYRDQSSYNFQPRPNPSPFYNVNPVNNYDYISPSSSAGPSGSGFSEGIEVPRYNADSSEWQIYAPSYPYPNNNRRRTTVQQVQTQQRQNPFRFYYY